MALPASHTAAYSAPRLGSASYRVSGLQAALVVLLLLAGTPLIMLTVGDGVATTLTLFGFAVLVGVWLCVRTVVSVGEPKLPVVSLWLLKLFVTLLLLYFGWIPRLDPGSASWGYDPQRYFWDSWNLVDNGWVPTIHLNYQGVLYYYGAVFSIFGHNPVAPALVNALVTLISTLFLIRFVATFTADKRARVRLLGWLLLVPEVLWYDVMTSRESLVAALLLIGTLSPAGLLVGNGRATLRSLIYFCCCLLGILMVRASMVLPLLAAILAIAVLVRARRSSGAIVKALLISVGVTAVILAPILQQISGGYQIDYLETLKQLHSTESNVASGAEWAEGSIGLLLTPDSIWEALLFLPPRMLLYLAAPLPNVGISLADLRAGDWSAWQTLMTLPTALLMLFGFPYVLAATSYAWRIRKLAPAALILPIVFWVNFTAVAGGNIIIHERYRLMFSLVLFACMWWGHAHSREAKVQRWRVLWLAVIGTGGIAALAYKVLM